MHSRSNTLLLRTALGATVPALTQHFPKDAVTLAKTRFSMCLPSGETADFLTKHKAKSVMIVGIESHVCVLQTTLELLAKGYDVFVIRDAISSCNREEVSTAVEVRLLLFAPHQLFMNALC